MKMKSEKLLLPVKFTDAELQAIGLALAAKHLEIGRLAQQKKDEADRFKALIDDATAEASKLSRDRVNGWEDRYVDCETTYDFAKGTRRTIRVDTREVVTEGPMTDDELKLAQMAFDDVKKKAN